MARNDDSQRNENTPSRVYKSSDVHKRRVDRKGRAKKGSQAPVPAEPPSAEEPFVEANPAPAEPPVETRSTRPPSDSEAPFEQEEPAKTAVVITPEFGRRTQAQKEADDRWFAALAEQSTERIPMVKGDQPVAEQPTEEASEAKAVSEEQSPAQQPEQPQGQPQDQPQDQPQEQPPTQQKKGLAPLSYKSRIKQPSPLKRKIAIGAGIVLFVAIIAVGLFFTWNRWYRFDDHADMQGQWYVVGTTVPVEIDETSIHLTKDVVYQYELNTQDKTIRYTFGPMEGQGRYWFSDNRQYLVITDGDQFTSSGTAVDDLLRKFEELIDTAQGVESALPEGEGIIAFSREPDAEALAKEKAEAEAKKKAEEEARKAEERRAAEEAAAAAAEAEEYYYEEEPAAEEQPAEEPPAEEASAEGEGGEQ